MSNQIKIVSGVAALALIMIGGLFTVNSLSAPSTKNIQEPQLAHHHLRMQMIVDGEFQHFNTGEYQQDYAKDGCSGDITESPIHFHDNDGQMLHIHWADITGGQVLKYYGLNYIKGDDDKLGVRKDEDGNKVDVPIRGNLLPEPNKDSKVWVYISDDSNEDGYVKYDTNKFLKTDFEEIYGIESTAYAHSVDIHDENMNDDTSMEGEDDTSPYSEEPEFTQDQLSQLNNVLGDLVIFIQNEEPSNDKITNRFNDFEQLGKSICGG